MHFLDSTSGSFWVDENRFNPHAINDCLDRGYIDDLAIFKSGADDDVVLFESHNIYWSVSKSVVRIDHQNLILITQSCPW